MLVRGRSSGRTCIRGLWVVSLLVLTAFIGLASPYASAASGSTKHSTVTSATLSTHKAVSGKPLTLTSTVRDSAKGIKTFPIGNVKWSDGGKRGIFSSKTCVTSTVTTSSSSCSVTYTPKKSGIVKVVATYSGDSQHKGSRRSVSLAVAKPASLGFPTNAAPNTITGHLWQVPEAVARNAVPANVPGTTPDVVFDVNSPLSFSATGATRANWLASGGAFDIVENTAGTLASLMDNNVVGTLIEFTGVVTVTTGQTFTVAHDDGLTLIIGGLNLGFNPGPTSPVTTTVTYTGPTGSLPFQLVYGECCSGPAVLQVDLPFTKAPASTATVVFDASTSAPWSGTETVGASAYDTATVTGVTGFIPSGNVTYNFFTNGDCSGTPTAQVVDLSSGLVPNSATTAPLAAGSYSYNATYSGDSNYKGATSSCEGLTVSVPYAAFDFSLSVSPNNDTVLRGGAGSYEVAITPVTGTPQPVTLSVVSGLPAGAVASFTNPVVPSGTSTLLVSTSVSGGLGDYNLTVLGQDGTASHTTHAILHVYDFTLNFSVCEQTVLRGSIAPYNLTLALVPGSSIVGLPPITLEASGLPPDATFTPQILFLSSTPVTTQLEVKTGNVSLGDYAFSITAVDTRTPEGGSRPANCGGVCGGPGVTPFGVHVYQPVISFACDATVVSPFECTISVSLASGSSTFGLPFVTLGFTGLPGGTLTACNPLTGTPPFTSTCTFTLVGFTGGEFSLGVFGSISGTLSGGTVLGAPAGGSPGQLLLLHIYDFSVLVTPQETVLRGGAAVYNVTILLTPGSTTVGLPTLALTLSGIPPGVAVSSFSPTSGPASGFTARLVLQTGSTTPLGDFRFNVTGTDTRPLLGGYRIGAGILHVYDFTIASSPASQTVTLGGTASYDETLTLLPGSTTIGLPEIRLTVSGLGTGAVANQSLASVVPSFAGNTSVLTVQSSPVGTFSITIIGNDTRIPEGGSRSSLPQSPQSLTVLPAVQGRMTGGGRFNVPFKLTHGFEVNCNANQGHSNLQVNWVSNGKEHHFHMTDLMAAVCSMNPSLGSPNPPKADFNTWNGTGTGRLNGVSGYTFFASFTDQGQPAAGKDISVITIWAPDGTVVLNVTAVLKGGAQQAHNN